MAVELKGAPVAVAIDERSRAGIAALAEKGIAPMLALVRVGEREDDIAYENGAVKRCERVGVAYQKVTLHEKVSQETLLAEIHKLNRDASVHGVLLFSQNLWEMVGRYIHAPGADDLELKTAASARMQRF